MAQARPMQFAIIDAIGPFFHGYGQRRVNWSKIPFFNLAIAGPERQAQWAVIRAEMEVFAARVVALGYNVATLDDVAHLTDHEGYEPPIREAIACFREEFRAIFAILRRHGLEILVTADYLVTSPAVDERLGDNPARLAEWFLSQMERFLDDFPEVGGVVLRIGESDASDVKDALRSRLVLRTARETNRLLKSLLPAFERRNKKLVFRTWTVGAHLIGDLIWNRGRLATAMDGIDSPAFLLSMKYGESDFFRYLPLNRHFFRIDLPKIVEFQTRPEYEGAGEYPSFIGWELERHARELATANNIAGFSVWCQTGGWHAFRRRAFLDPAAIWIELNTATAIRMLRDGMGVEQAVGEFFGPEKQAGAVELLRRSDCVIRELLYIPEFAVQKLFFRRVRIPPLVHVYWDSIFINPAVQKILAHFTRDPEAAIRGGEAAFEHFGPMLELAGKHGLPSEDIEFMRDTFGILLLARRFYLLEPDADLQQEILAAKAAYKKRWPRGNRQRYRIRVSFEPTHLNRHTLAWISRLLIRRQRGYRRILDQLFTLRALSWIVLFFHARHRDKIPKVLRKTAMGVDTLFR